KDIQEIGGLVRPVRMEVHSNLREGYQTILTMVEADFATVIGDAVFTRDFLEQGY
ncbi:MAG: outer membrane lipoprotein-sorting protein, partial [Firmicutes bacterium]|nr:outer membrane lipoprotein-sorting protein [Bacillota bacterium]